MADSRFVLPGPETVSMSGDAAKRLIGCGSGDAALLYLYILVSGGRFSAEDAAAHIGRSTEQVDAAMDILERLGLVSARDEKPKLLERPDELPQYTCDDVAQELEQGSSFKLLVEEVQRALGKMLSSDDLKKLFGIYDYLGLPPDVILELVIHCIGECRRRNGPGRMPTMRYIEKVAYTWEREGIFSLDAAEKYIMRLDSQRTAEDRLAKVLGITDRTLSTSERRYIDSWSGMGFDDEVIEAAYDRTVLKTGRLTWRYMDSILASWHSKGIHTARDVAEKDAPPRPRSSGEKPGEGVPRTVTTDELEGMRETLRRIKGG